MDPDTAVVWCIGLTLVLGTMAPFVIQQRRRERHTLAAETRAKSEGLDVPGSLHPVINLDVCIGTGACLSVCPEQDIIGIRTGQAVAVSPANCIGHGLCERSCPVEAIQLVFGTSKRGVDIPRIRENFETNVPGLFIVGELGGMGLIRNAFEQGRQCVEQLAAARSEENHDRLDLVIVGCGPAGLSAALTAQHLGLRTAVLEREDIGGTVRHYPRKKVVMTEPLRVPGYGRIGAREILKEDLVEVWEEVVEGCGLQVETGVTVSDVQPSPDGGFQVSSDAAVWRADRVILAIGRRGVPRKLGIPGEGLPNVAYTLKEPEAYRGDRVVVVGGGDSAVEAGLTLAEQPGTEVRIAYRGTSFSRAKPKNRDRVRQALDSGALSVLWSTAVVENEKDRIRLHGGDDGDSVLPNDHLFVFAGGELPTPFLTRCGIQVDTKFGER